MWTIVIIVGCIIIALVAGAWFMLHWGLGGLMDAIFGFNKPKKK